MTKNKLFLLSLLTLAIFLMTPEHATAAGKKKGGRGAFRGGTISAGFGVGIVTANQSGLNTMIDVSKTAVAATTSNFSSGIEYMGHVTFRFSNDLVAIQIRPTYFEQSTSGTGTDGSHSYSLKGYSLFPLVRLIPLSNEIIDFYLQAGVGYGKIDGSVTNGPRNVNFSGSSFGMQAGIGADFYFFPDHGFGVEGNYRYLPVVRNIASSGTGPTNLPYGSSQAAADRELEDLNGSDVATSMSGISAQLTYSYTF